MSNRNPKFTISTENDFENLKKRFDFKFTSTNKKTKNISCVTEENDEDSSRNIIMVTDREGKIEINLQNLNPVGNVKKNVKRKTKDPSVVSSDKTEKSISANLESNMNIRDAMNNISNISNSISKFKKQESIKVSGKIEDSVHEIQNDNVNIVINFNNYNSFYDNDFKSFHNDDTYMKNGKKKKNIFRNNPIYNLSSRMINDEYNKNNLVEVVENEVKFIDNIKVNVQSEKFKTVKIPLKKLLNINNKIFLRIFHFIFDNMDNLMLSNKLLHNKIKFCLCSVYSDLIENFRWRYTEDFQLYEYYFERNSKPNKNPCINIYLKAKIISKKSLNSSFTFSLIHRYFKVNILKYSESDDLILTWKIDYRKKSDTCIWFASEAEEYEQSVIRQCYAQPVVSLTKDDFFEIKFPILSHNSMFDYNTFQFTDLRIEQVPLGNFFSYEKTAVQDSSHITKYFDDLRYCEIENVVKMWKNEKSLTNRKLVNDVKRIFEKCFKIVNFVYDISRFYFFKVKLEANKIGVVKRNNYLSFEIEVVAENENTYNEIQCLGLLNYTDKKYQVRLGQYIMFYFTDLYG